MAATLAAGALAAACGGSATESPWPVEPDNLVTGPEGEEGPGKARKDRHPDGGVEPDSGTKPPPNVEP